MESSLQASRGHPFLTRTHNESLRNTSPRLHITRQNSRSTDRSSQGNVLPWIKKANLVRVDGKSLHNSKEVNDARSGMCARIDLFARLTCITQYTLKHDVSSRRFLKPQTIRKRRGGEDVCSMRRRKGNMPPRFLLPFCRGFPNLCEACSRDCLAAVF